MIAYGDESVRLSTDPPAYLLGAVILGDGADLSGMRSLLPKSASKLHWRDMPDDLRRRSVEELAALDAAHTIVIASPLNATKQERARRLCMETLLPMLEAKGVGELVLESRNTANEDRKDVELRDSMLKKGYISSIRVSHARGDSDEGLWVPDQAIGAYGDSLKGDAGAWGLAWEEFLARAEVVEIAPR